MDVDSEDVAYIVNHEHILRRTTNVHGGRTRGETYQGQRLL
jgi:hypothetical protein